MKTALHASALREYRSAPAGARECRARATLERRTLTDAEKSSGYIGALTGEIPFNSDSGVLTKRGRAKPFVEQIAPDAFKRSLSEDKDIMANAGHTDDPLMALGRIGENLTVTVDSRSMKWEALVPDTQAGKDLMSLVDKKIIRGTSFEFEVRGQAGEKWETRDANLDQRTILDARLIAFNPVTWPAYEDSTLTVELRRKERAGAPEGRGYYGSYDGVYSYYDPTLSCDAVYASNALARATCELTDSLDYLRNAPDGGLADHARQEVADAADDVATLSAWLAANGATVNPDLVERANKKVAEARAANPTDLSIPDHARERRVRVLRLAPSTVNPT